MEQIVAQIKEILKDISIVSEETQKNEGTIVEISDSDNPLDPNLASYCFENILGFDIEHRIAEKINYIIEFDYKGTLASLQHFKLSYRLYISENYRAEILDVFSQVKPLLEKLFLLISEKSLAIGDFSMKNEAPDYFEKLFFYQSKIEKLHSREMLLDEKLSGQYDIIESTAGKYRIMKPKGADYLHNLHLEVQYDIEAYIDTFFSTLEHVLTLLYPFTWKSNLQSSYYKNYIKNSRWDWHDKIKDVCGDVMPESIIKDLRRLKEVYRNHNAHGGFSREMMAYVLIPQFGRFPLYLGKNYLKGFSDNALNGVSFEMYLAAKATFESFWKTLDDNYEIAMLFIRSGLPIPVDTNIYIQGNEKLEEVQWIIDKLWYDIDNQSNMDW